MDFVSRYLRAAFKALDEHILGDGPEPNDNAILSIDPSLGVLLDPPAHEADSQCGVWIRTEDGLPEEGEWVVVGSHKAPGQHYKCEFRRGKFWDAWSSTPQDRVDAWLRLPPLPAAREST